MTGKYGADHAKVLAPAPLFYGVLFIVGLIAQRVLPLALSTLSVQIYIGWLVILASIPIVLYAVLELKRVGTAFDARKSTSIIVEGGPFRYTRNPTYLSLTLLTVGLSLVLNSVWLLVGSVVATTLTHLFVVIPEETYLSAKFGDSYDSYVRRVRRWM